MAGCNDEEDPVWEAVSSGDPFGISVNGSGTDPRFAAHVKVFHSDGMNEVFDEPAELTPGPKKSKPLGAPTLTNVVIARVIIDGTSSADTKVEVKSTIGPRTHCHTVTARGLTTMVHTIRMKP